MAWTTEDKLEWLLRQPWRVHVDREDDGSYFARVDGLQGAVADGRNSDELQRNFWESLRETLRAYLETGDHMPLPGNTLPPWDAAPARTVQRVRYRLVGGSDLTPMESSTWLGAA